jgi:hypothetical protein
MHRLPWAALIALAVAAHEPVMVTTAAQASSATNAAVRPGYSFGIDLENDAATSANVAVGDLNGDGYLDVVLAKGRHWPLVDRVLLGDGKGGFPTAYNLSPTADRTYSGRLADLDGDGDLDVVVSNDFPDAKLVYLNDGKGHFQRGSVYGNPKWDTRNVTIADMDGDGLADILVANRAGRNKTANYICLNRGAGRFDGDCRAFSEESATTLAAGDMNGDGKMDIVVPHRDGGQSHVYLRDTTAGSLAFRPLPFGPPDSNIRVAEAADMDGDGRLDIVAIDERTGTWLFRQSEAGGFRAGEALEALAKTPYAMTVADVDRDQRADVIVGYVEAPSAVFFNEGAGKPFTTIRFGDGKGTVYGFAVADLNRDGLLDIAAARSEATNVLYLARAATP